MFNVVKHDEFTDSEPVNKAILGLSIIRLFLFFIIFIITLNQSIHELIHAKDKNKYLSPRLFTFSSIAIYTGCRVVMIIVFFYDKTVDNGSISAAISVLGTCFQYIEWVYICVFWISILKSFFTQTSSNISTPSSKQDELLKNIKTLWIFSFIIVSILIIWTIVQIVFNFYLLDTMNDTYKFGQIIIVVVIGGFFLINGIILAKQIKTHGNKNPILEDLFGRVVKMSLALLVMVVGVFLVNIIIFIMGIGDYDKRYYGFYIVLCLLEFFQLSVVLYSLGGDSYIGYFKFKRIGSTNSSSNTPPSKNNNNNMSIKLNNVGDSNV